MTTAADPPSRRDAKLAADDVMRALAGRLPSDVSVLDAAAGPVGFDARRSALWRAYVYLIWNSPAPNPMLGRYATWVARDLDPGALAEAMDVVAGTHDFSSFARVREEQSPVRTVLEASAGSDGPVLRVRIVADAFLHQMVRSIVGSALEVAAGRRSLGWMRQALLACDRSAAGPVAPPQGLTLVDVGYPAAEWTRREPVPWPWGTERRTERASIGESL